MEGKNDLVFLRCVCACLHPADANSKCRGAVYMVFMIAVSKFPEKYNYVLLFSSSLKI